MKKLSRLLYHLLIFAYPLLMTAFYHYYLHGFLAVRNVVSILLLLYALCLYMFYFIYMGNKIGVYKVTEITYSNILALIVTNVFTYLILLIVIQRPFSLLKFLLMFLIQAVVTCVWVYLANQVQLKLYGTHRILLIHGKNSNPNLIKQKLHNRNNCFFVKEIVSEEKGLNHIFSRCEEYGTIMMYGLKPEHKELITKYCFEKSKQFFLVPEISDLISLGTHPAHIMDTPLYVNNKYLLTMDQLLWKRIFDLVCGLIGLVIASPFMLITAIAIKLEDHGPVLYKQKRLTTNGKEFYVYKFRSMIVDAEKNSGARLSSGENDSRITKTGKVIRAIRFDELPQIFNIIKGDMSIVGPRPERPEIAEQYYEQFPEFKYRLKVKAGLTGYAQVYGKYNTTPEDKLKLDMIYINNYSFYLDLKLIFYTVKILFMKESTEGIDADATTAMISTSDEEPAI